MAEHILEGHKDEVATLAEKSPNLALRMSDFSRSHLAELEDAFRRLRGPLRYDPASRWPGIVGNGVASPIQAPPPPPRGLPSMTFLPIHFPATLYAALSSAIVFL